jgi:hypothetical protein
VRATWALFKALRAEYERHQFATFANEQHKPKNGLYMGQLYSSASIAKQYLRLLGIAPLLEKQPDFKRKYLGWFISAYFGGRADVRVRKLDLPIRLLDFTAMYATIFCLQRLDRLLTAPAIRIKPVAGEIRALVGQMASDNPSVSLFDPKVWLQLNCLVLVDPSWAILPIRMREAEKRSLYRRRHADRYAGGPLVHAGRRVGVAAARRTGACDSAGDPRGSQGAPVFQGYALPGSGGVTIDGAILQDDRGAARDRQARREERSRSRRVGDRIEANFCIRRIWCACRS